METKVKKVLCGITVLILGFVAYRYTCVFAGAPKYDTEPPSILPQACRRAHEANTSTTHESPIPTTSAIRGSFSPTASTTLEPVGPTTSTMMNNGATVSAGADSISPKVGLIGTDPKSYCCDDSSAGESLEDLCGKTSGSGDTEECTCVDYMYCRLVVATGISSNHFDESRDMIASVQKFLPNTKLIVYDIGLTTDERKTVSTYCNVELRRFPFELYPPHVKELFKYAWKPIMLRDVAEEYEVILYGDASMRLVKGMKDTVLPLLQTFPFVAGPVHELPIISMVHEGMLIYLNVSRQDARKVLLHTIQATIHTTWATKQIKEKLIKYWVDCALHPECIAPPGAGLSGCNFIKLLTNPGEYIGCHRYDQSALNVILYREFGAEVWRSVQHDELARTVFKIERDPTFLFYYEIKHCS